MNKLTYFKASGEDFEDVFVYPSEYDTHSLIAAAPKMLEALESLLVNMEERQHDLDPHYIEQAKRIIEKARRE